MAIVTGWTQYSALTLKESYTGTNATPSRILGDQATDTKWAQSFTAASSYTMSQIIVSLNKYGSPTDNVWLEIWSDSSGPGSVITNGTSGTIGGGSLTTSYADYTFTFSTPPSITNTTKYWIVFARSGANDSNNFYRIGGVVSGGSGLKKYTPWADVASNQVFYKNYTSAAVANTYYASLASEPTDLYFDGTAGTKRTSIANCTSNNDWYWASSVMYIYSSSAPSGRLISTLATVTGTVSASLAAITATAAGSPRVTGTGAAALAPVTSAVSGSPVAAGTIAATLAPFTAAVEGETSVTGVSGSVSATLAPISALVEGTPTVTGTSIPSLAPVTGVMAGSPVIEGTIVASLGPLTAEIVGTTEVIGTTGIVVATLAPLSASFSGSPIVSGIITATLGSVEAVSGRIERGPTEMILKRNTAGQYLYVYAHDTDADEPKTGDAANITAYLIKDNGSPVQTNDIHPTEVDSVNVPGTYRFTMTQAETDFDVGRLQSSSTTSDVYIAPVDLTTLKSAYAWVRSA